MLCQNNILQLISLNVLFACLQDKISESQGKKKDVNLCKELNGQRYRIIKSSVWGNRWFLCLEVNISLKLTAI